MWGKSNPYTLLVGMQIDIDTIENSMEFVQKIKNYHMTQQPLFWISTPNITSMFTAALSTVAKTWKQLKCPLRDNWIEKMWYI